FFGSQSRGRGLGAEAGLRLVAEWQTGLWSGLNAGNAHLRNRFVPGAAIISVAFATKSLCYRKFLCFNAFTRSILTSTLSEATLSFATVLIQRMTEFV